MRLLAIGDVHGCSRALDALLSEVKPQPEDQLVFLGDYVDRGPDSAGVMESVRRMKQRLNVIALRGNHEQMMMDARNDNAALKEWLRNGGDIALASYSILGDEGKLDDVPDAHWKFLDRDCVDWHETERHFFVHANAYADLPLNEQPMFMLRWEHLYQPVLHCSGKIMVCGHTSQKSGLPLNWGHTICIDTWPHGKGWLTCFDANSGRVWQANQQGQTRNAWIEDFEAM